MNLRFATALSQLEIVAADAAEFSHGVRGLTNAVDALGVELLLAFKDLPVDDDGFLLPELLEASAAADFAAVELELISRA